MSGPTIGAIEQRLLVMQATREQLEQRLAGDNLSTADRAQTEALLAECMGFLQDEVDRARSTQPLLGLVKFVEVLQTCQADPDIMGSAVPARELVALINKIAGRSVTEASQLDTDAVQPVATALARSNFIPAADIAELTHQTAECLRVCATLMETMLAGIGEGKPRADMQTMLEQGGRVGIEASVDTHGETAIALVAIPMDGARRVIVHVAQAPSPAGGGAQTRH